jgi:hypothetical protein
LIFVIAIFAVKFRCVSRVLIITEASLPLKPPTSTPTTHHRDLIMTLFPVSITPPPLGATAVIIEFNKSAYYVLIHYDDFHPFAAPTAQPAEMLSPITGHSDTASALRALDTHCHKLGYISPLNFSDEERAEIMYVPMSTPPIRADGPEVPFHTPAYASQSTYAVIIPLRPKIPLPTKDPTHLPRDPAKRPKYYRAEDFWPAPATPTPPYELPPFVAKYDHLHD